MRANSCILVTGATSGFGEATARLFAAQGWKLILTGRRLERLSQLQDELGGEEQVHIGCFDISDRAACEDFFSSLPDSLSNIDVLFNNAGLALGLEPADETSLDDWQRMVDTNINGLIYCTHLALPKMTARGSGYIINMGSVAGNWPYPGGHVYCASKAFVKQFSLALRADLLGKGVKVTNIEPGNAETEFSMIRFSQNQEKADSVYANTLALNAQNIADTIWWLVNTPPNMNVTTMEIMPIDEANGPFSIHRRP
jgi:3-hydroxy acid dehydrogenase/malonic semialdehyde reductase